MSERPADNSLAIGLEPDGVNRAVGPGDRQPRVVYRPIALQTRDAVVELAVHLLEVAAENHLAVPLQGQRVNDVVRSRTGIKAQVQRAIGIEPRNALARDVIES